MPTQKKTRPATRRGRFAGRPSQGSSDSRRGGAGLRSAETRRAGRGGGGQREVGESGDSHQGARRSQRSGTKHLTYSKWIDSPDDHEDCQGQSLATRNHDVILQWARLRKALPSVVGDAKGRDGVLRIDFPGYGGKRLKKVGWDKWFNMFDKQKLVFLYQERTKDGSKSTFFKLVT